MPTKHVADQVALSDPAAAGADLCDAHQTDTTEAWYAIRCRSRCEFAVSDALNASIQTFLPTRTELVRWSDRTKARVLPLFPGYIFARFDRRRAVSDVLATSGVVQILGADEMAAVPEVEIESLRRIVNSSAQFAECAYQPGEVVTLKRGPLAGVTGTVVRSAGSTRLLVSVEILNRTVGVTIDLGAVAR